MAEKIKLEDLLNLDYKERYKQEYNTFKGNFNRKSIYNLLSNISKENNLLELKEEMLAICQLLSYSIVEFGETKKENLVKHFLSYFFSMGAKKELQQKQEEAYIMLKDIFALSREVLGAYFFFHSINIEDIKTKLCAHDSALKEICGKRRSKTRDFNQENGLIILLDTLKKRYRQDKPDIIFTVAAGGIEPALLTSIALGQPNVEMVRYAHRKGYGNENFQDGTIDKEVKLPNALERVLKDKVGGKKVLIVDDRVCSGNTMDKVSEVIRECNPVEIVMAALCVASTEIYLKRK